jgi:hypothetical protein
MFGGEAATDNSQMRSFWFARKWESALKWRELLSTAPSVRSYIRIFQTFHVWLLSLAASPSRIS